ncbi:MAG: T9SS type A sorting domain-containing protein [Chitinophagales bacterium]|nr:T9SS type A sorting domain-containing protein [Chitinophagales bacterium]
MKNLTAILIILFTVGLNSIRAQDIWTQKADFGGGAISGAVAFSINDKGYVGAFGTEAFWQYDPATDVWTQKADYGGGCRSGAVGFSIGSKGYLGTGSNGLTLYKDFWEYDPSTNIWIKKSDYGGEARKLAVGFSIGNNGYIGTGYGGTISNDFWEYESDADKWTKKTNYPGLGHWGGVAFSIDKFGYVGTGVGSDEYQTYDFWKYNPTSDKWNEIAGVNGWRSGAVGFSANGKGYVGLGSGDALGYLIEYNDIEEYDPIKGYWRITRFPGGARTGAVGFSISGKVYIGMGFKILGSSDDIYNDFWEYTPETTPSCIVPTGEATVNITGTSAKLKWDIVDEAKRYNVRYRAAGTNEWIILTNIISNSIAISGLIPNTLYLWEVKCICSATPVVSSYWSAKESFTTGTLRIETDPATSMQLYPNPVTESFTLDLQLGTTTDQSATIYLLNTLGQTVHSSKEVVNGELTKVITMPSSATSGWYIVRVVMSDQVFEKKLLYQK